MSSRPRVRIISPIPSVPETDESDFGEENESAEGNEKPKHHQVLYELLGEDKAESILNPKIEEPSSARRQSIHPDGKPLLLLPSIDTGMGAEAIWATLKEKSERRIKRMEKRIPEEWKQAYNAFLRDRLAREKPLHFRSFTDKPDVPDLDILRQHDYIYKVRKIRNHTNVMFRSSKSNLDHTTLIMNNNPLPDCTKNDKNSSLNRYFDGSYLQRPHSSQPMAIEYPAPPASPQPRNLHFLTEQGARCKGTFYAKYSDEDTMKMVTDVPGYEAKLPPSMTERYSLSAPVNTPSARREWKNFEKKISAARLTKWEPLTFGSLMEYAPSKPILGAGDFSHGTASRWRNTASAGI